MTTEQKQQTIDFWAIVELFGHQRIAGRVTEQSIAGTNMLRVDVPEVNKQSFTRFFGGAAIYAINPCTEEVARKYVEANTPLPVYVWEFHSILKSLKSGEEMQQQTEDEDEDGDELPNEQESDSLNNHI